MSWLLPGHFAGVCAHEINHLVPLSRAPSRCPQVLQQLEALTRKRGIKHSTVCGRKLRLPPARGPGARGFQSCGIRVRVRVRLDKIMQSFVPLALSPFAPCTPFSPRLAVLTPRSPDPPWRFESNPASVLALYAIPGLYLVRIGPS